MTNPLHGPFRKSTRSDGSGNCVEVAEGTAVDGAFVRDSKDVTGPVLTFGSSNWGAFIADVKGGEFDL
ncbi:DUF397 domain-containing protein [Micromonospora sp. CPCC 206060]|uniref:DUF397 domain-containing protein n=1 Tax=Micromonospora sp. CPCC 206060 TaxID=3122406 RepID=UPI002FF19F8E